MITPNGGEDEEKLVHSHTASKNVKRYSHSAKEQFGSFQIGKVVKLKLNCNTPSNYTIKH